MFIDLVAAILEITTRIETDAADDARGADALGTDAPDEIYGADGKGADNGP